MEDFNIDEMEDAISQKSLGVLPLMDEDNAFDEWLDDTLLT